MVSPAVVDELKRIVADSGVTKEDDEKVSYSFFFNAEVSRLWLHSLSCTRLFFQYHKSASASMAFCFLFASQWPSPDREGEQNLEIKIGNGTGRFYVLQWHNELGGGSAIFLPDVFRQSCDLSQ